VAVTTLKVAGAGAGAGAGLGTGGLTDTLLLPFVLQLVENLSGNLATSPPWGDTVPFQLLATAGPGPGVPRVGKSTRPLLGTVLATGGGGSARARCFTYTQNITNQLKKKKN
jgi:hypothetical protein